MEEKEKKLSDMTDEELAALVCEQQLTINQYAKSFDSLFAFYKVVTNARVVANTSKVTNTDAFYKCVTAAADAVGYVKDPSLKF